MFALFFVIDISPALWVKRLYLFTNVKLRRGLIVIVMFYHLFKKEISVIRSTAANLLKKVKNLR